MLGRRLSLIARIAALAATMAILVLPSAARANMGVPWDEGEPVGEPSALEYVAIAQETLVLDLRPVAEGRPVRVTARYQVQNNGPEIEADLVFASPGVENGTVSIDGRPLAVEPVRDPDTLPATWRPPATVPGIDGRPIEYNVRGLAGVAFEALIPPGRHEIAVSYDVEPAAYHGGSRAMKDYLLAYTLSPARTWQSFGTLDVTVEVPPGWEAATSVPLDREGNTLRGRFDGLPADSIGLTVRPPEPVVLPLGIPALVAGSLVIGAFAWGVGRWTRRRGSGSGATLAIAGLCAIGGALVLAVLGALAMAGERSMADGPHASRSYGYTSMLLIIGAVFLALVLGLLAGPIGLFLGRRGRARR